MEKKINYQKEYNTVVSKLTYKPKLLLHTCCGPCFTIPYELLKNYFEINIIFNNSNIYPKEEHDRRLEELKRYNKEINSNIRIIETPYDNITYIKDLLPFSKDKEGHERCRICFRKRLAEGFKFAKDNGFDFFGTVMTISRYKNAQDINKIGYELEKEFAPVKWLPADFKKNNGYEDSLIIIKKHNMYFQEYCGCQFSIRNKKSE